MTVLADHLDDNELIIVNEIVRSILILTNNHESERVAYIATQAAAQITGVTMALGSQPRDLDAHRLDQRTKDLFEQSKSRSYLHAMAESMRTRTIEGALTKIGVDHIERVARGGGALRLVE